MSEPRLALRFTVKLSSVTRIGIDLAKKVFGVHAVDAMGGVVVVRSINCRTLLKFSGRRRLAWS
jgi:hypothetical protein